MSPMPCANPGWVRVGATLLFLAEMAAAATVPPQGEARPGVRAFSCAVAYLPARTTWVRTLELRYDAARLSAVLIDGQAPYTFSVQGTQVATSLDNERIVVDVASGQWRSDFRDKATGQGRCE